MASRTYSKKVAFVYVFNALVGAGVFALPKAFSDAGIVWGTCLIFALCILSYITACYLIEAMAAANAYQKKTVAIHQPNSQDNEDKEDDDVYRIVSNNLTIETGFILTAKPNRLESQINVVAFLNDVQSEQDIATGDTPTNEELLEDYEIVENLEYGAMANVFFPKIGIVLQYLCFCLFSWGNIAYFNIVISTSLSYVACILYSNYHGSNNFENLTVEAKDNSTATFYFFQLTCKELYYICLTVLLLTVGPFTFCKINSSKWIQLGASVVRLISFIMMIILAIVQLITEGVSTPLIAGSITTVPVLYGIVVYSFKCHETLPTVIIPVSSKKGLYKLLFSDFISTLLVYLLIVYTGVFAFPGNEINVLHNLTFLPPMGDYELDQLWRLIFGIFLALLPVATLGSCYPIYAIALRENIKSLSTTIIVKWKGNTPPIMERLVFPLLVLDPSAVIAYTTQQVDLLVAITGALPGVGIQIILPAALVLAGQYKIKKQFGTYDNPYKTILSHKILVVGILIWSGISIILICVSFAFDPPSTDNYKYA